MINFYNQVPTVYNNASRDFQYFSWLINIVFNYVKHNVDTIYSLPNTSNDTKMAELLAMTLGFKVKRSYDKKQLAALVAILPLVLKYKGTKKALEMAAEAIVMASGAIGDISVDVDEQSALVTLPKGLVDITLFIDLLDYILPAGMSCHIIRKNIKLENLTTDVTNTDVLRLFLTDDFDVYRTAKGVSNIYNPICDPLTDLTDNIPNIGDFTANTFEDAFGEVLQNNPSLLENAIIPVLNNSKLIIEELLALYTTETDNTHKQLYAKSADGSEVDVALQVKNKKQIL